MEKHSGMVEFVKRLRFGILRRVLDAVYSIIDEKCNASVINASVIWLCWCSPCMWKDCPQVGDKDKDKPAFLHYSDSKCELVSSSNVFISRGEAEPSLVKSYQTRPATVTFFTAGERVWTVTAVVGVECFLLVFLTFMGLFFSSLKTGFFS